MDEQTDGHSDVKVYLLTYQSRQSDPHIDRQTDRQRESHDRLSVGQTNAHRHKDIHTDIKSKGTDLP